MNEGDIPRSGAAPALAIRAVTIEQCIVVGAAHPTVFQGAVAIDPAVLVRAHGVAPGVANFDGARQWARRGDQRHLRLTDGTHLTETLTAFVDDDHFIYRVDEFQGPLNRIASGAQGEWRFTPLNDHQTRVTWRYSFQPTRPIAAAILKLFGRIIWSGFMRAVLTRLKDAVERPNTDR